MALKIAMGTGVQVSSASAQICVASVHCAHAVDGSLKTAAVQEGVHKVQVRNLHGRRALCACGGQLNE